MTVDKENGHFDLMDQMDRYGGVGSEADLLAGVAEMAAGAKDSAEVEEGTPLGQRIRALRKRKGLSRIDVSQRTGIGEKSLTAIEEGEANPPLGELVKLAKALDMKMGTLLTGGEDRPYSILRVAERQAMSRFSHARETSYGYSYQALAPGKRNRSMEPFLVTLRPPTEEVKPSAHDGEEFIFVIKGRMEAVMDDAKEILEPGDCIYYDSNQPHLVRPAGDEPTLVLAVLFHRG